MPFGTEVSLGQGHIVLDGDPAPLSQNGHSPNFRPISVVAKRLDGSVNMPLGSEVGLSPRHTVLDGDPALPPAKGHSPPIFGPCDCLLWPKRRPSQLLLSTCTCNKHVTCGKKQT